MLERDIEKKHREKTEDQGGKLIKFLPYLEAGMPDRMRLLPIPPKYRALVAQFFRFIEFKAPRKGPRKLQEHKHKELREMGFTVDVIDSVPGEKDA